MHSSTTIVMKTYQICCRKTNQSNYFFEYNFLSTTIIEEQYTIFVFNFPLEEAVDIFYDTGTNCAHFSTTKQK